MNIVLRELKAHRKALIIWSVCMFLLVLSGMVKGANFTGSGQSINELLGIMPTSVKALLGFGAFDVSIISGYFAVLFIYMELTAAIHAALLGAGIISKEENAKTTEFILVKPVSRFAVITSKFIAALINIIIINIVSLISSLALVAAYNKGKDIDRKSVV